MSNMITWPNLFLYSSNTGGSVTYSKVPQHTWKAGELIRNKHWNNLKDTPPKFKKITILDETDSSITFDINYEYAEKILLNGGGLFTVVSGTDNDVTYSNIYYITLGDFQNGRFPERNFGSWQRNENGYLQFDESGDIK